MHHSLQSYYNQIAGIYDDDRFNNSYGRFIHHQEQYILRQHLGNGECQPVIDLACGTGRLMSWCQTGVDISAGMMDIARQKYPDRQFVLTSALDTGLPGQSFRGAICFHLIMHLEQQQLPELLREAHRLLQKGGQLILDVPSRERRTLLQYKTSGWHGANSYSQAAIRQWCAEDWTITAETGIAFLPIHRFPVRLRPLLTGIDHVLCRSVFKKWASYRVYVLTKQ